MKDSKTIAREMTNEAAHIQDWKLRRKADREMKQIAIELMKGDGYVVATARELAARYPGQYEHTAREDSARMIWCVCPHLSSCIGRRLYFAAIDYAK